MNKDWDKAVVSTEIWKECLRVLKAGSFAFIMSSPRQDVLCKMILNLINAGFETNFTSIYWTYASGFPKAANVSKLVDKKPYKLIYSEIKEYLSQTIKNSQKTKDQIDQECGFTACRYSSFVGKEWGSNLPTKEKWDIMKSVIGLDNRYDDIIIQVEREIIGQKKWNNSKNHFVPTANHKERIQLNDTKSATEAAKKLDGSYAGFQPKPALETILVVMKPLSEKSYVDQALNNGKGITWLDDCRIPIDSADMETRQAKNPHTMRKSGNNVLGDYSMSSTDSWECPPSRFPANLIVSDDSLNDGKITKGVSGGGPKEYTGKGYPNGSIPMLNRQPVKTFYNDSGSYSRYFSLDKWYEAQFIITPKPSPSERGEFNKHPTVKSIKLMSYLITMGSRENDIILDPFIGSGTTAIAAIQLHRRFIGIEKELEYVEIANTRLKPYLVQTKLM